MSFAPLPFQSESEPEMLARFPAALAKVWEFPGEAVAVLAGAVAPASSLREHVFDFPDGTRMQVTREHAHDLNSTWVHISFYNSAATTEYLKERAHRIVPRFCPLAKLRIEMVSPAGGIQFFFDSEEPAKCSGSASTSP